jgi:hypothetical protein
MRVLLSPGRCRALADPRIEPFFVASKSVTALLQAGQVRREATATAISRSAAHPFALAILTRFGLIGRRLSENLRHDRHDGTSDARRVFESAVAVPSPQDAAQQSHQFIGAKRFQDEGVGTDV